MQKPIPVAIELPPALLLALGRVAREAGLSATEYVAAVLASALVRTPRRPLGPAEIVRQAVLASVDWLDLQHRLRRTGYVLRRDEAGNLMLHDWPLNRPLLPMAELGHSMADLMLQFHAPFPAEVLAATAALPVARPQRAA